MTGREGKIGNGSVILYIIRYFPAISGDKAPVHTHPFFESVCGHRGYANIGGEIRFTILIKDPQTVLNVRYV